MDSNTIKQGTWVQIHNIVLHSEERTGKLPDDTKKVPLEMWVKGFLKEDAVLNDVVEVETITGRSVKGKLVAENPTYNYGFGEEFVPELLRVGIQAREIMRSEA